MRSHGGAGSTGKVRILTLSLKKKKKPQSEFPTDKHGRAPPAPRPVSSAHAPVGLCLPHPAFSGTFHFLSHTSPCLYSKPPKGAAQHKAIHHSLSLSCFLFKIRLFAIRGIERQGRMDTHTHRKRESFLPSVGPLPKISATTRTGLETQQQGLRPALHVGCWCYKQWLDLLLHHAGPCLCPTNHKLHTGRQEPHLPSRGVRLQSRCPKTLELVINT